MKRLITTLAIISALALTGCGYQNPATSDGTNLKAAVIETPDGRHVTCIKWDSSNYAGGLSCDWGGAK